MKTVVPGLIGIALAAMQFATVAQPLDEDEILLNPGFEQDADNNELPDHWNTSRDRIRWREDVYMSKNYTITSIPPAYVLATQDIALEPGEPYTLTMRCKGVGGGLAGALIVHGQDRPQREMPILWNVRVSDQYEDYIRTFTAPNPVARLYLYNIGKTKGEVTYDRVSLRRGLPDRVVITKLSFRDIDQPVSPPKPTRHIDWASPLAGGPIKAYITLRSFRCLRQEIELEQRLDLDSDVVHTGYEGKAAASITAGRAMDRLQTGEYEVYVVPSRVSDMMAITIRKAVEAGAGLVVVEGFGRSKHFIGDTPLESVPQDDWLLAGIPWKMLPEDVFAGAATGLLGKGRVVRLSFPTETSRVWGLIPLQNSRTAWAQRECEYWEWWESLLARAVVLAAGRQRDCEVHIAPATDGAVRIRATSAPEAAQLRTSFRSVREIRFNGPLLRTPSMTQPLGNGLNLSLPGDFPGGGVILDWQMLDGDGGVVDWGSQVIDTPQTVRIESVTAELKGSPGARLTEATVRLQTDEQMPITVTATLIDAVGRTISWTERRLALAPGGQTSIFALPVRSPQTVLHRVFVAVVRQGREEDSAWTNLLCPEVGPANAASDFTALPWHPGMSHPLIVAQYTELTREIGLNADFPGDPFLGAELGMPVATYMGGMGMFRENKHIETGVRRRCLHNPEVIADIRTKSTESAERSSGSGLFAVGITDEAFLSSRHNRTEFCFSDYSQEAYQAWLRARYGALDALNRQWDTQYASWDELRGAHTEDVRGTPNFAPFVDFRTFMTDTWIAACRRATDAYHQVLPDVPVGHTNTFGANPFNGNDYWKLATQTGFGWGQEYSEAIKGTAHKAIFDLWRSFVETPQARRSRETGGNANAFFNYGWIGYHHSVEAANYEPWWLVLHGSRGVSYYATNSIDAERGVSWALVFPTLSLTPYSLAVKDALADLRDGCGKLLMEFEREAPQIGILWSHPSMLVAWCESSWDNPVPDEQPGTDSYGAYFRSAFNFRQHVNENQLDYVYISGEQVLDGTALSNLDLLFLPFTVAISEEVADALDAFVRNGGTLVGDVRCLRTDEHGTPFDDDALLRRLFGVSRPGADGMSYEASTVTFGQAMEGVSMEGRTVEVFAHERLGPAGATVCAQHADGAPALCVSKRGSGRAIYLNFLLPDYDDTTRELIRQICAQADVPRPVRVEANTPDGPLPRCYERNTFTRGSIAVHAFIRDHRRCDDNAPVQIHFPENRHVYELRKRAYLGQTARVETAIAPGGTALFSCLPYRVEDVTISCDTNVLRGDDLTVDLSVRAVGAQAGDHVIHVELMAPDGTSATPYTHNVLARQGKATLTLPLALNDAPGTWTIRARDILSGTESKQNILIR